MRWRRGWLALPALALLAVSLVALSCGGDGDDDAGTEPTPSMIPSATFPAGPSPTPAPITQLKVSFINLYSPLTVDGSPVPGQTQSARIALLSEEIRKLDPDVILFTEASWTSAGNAVDELVNELKLDYAYMRANPGFALDNAEAEPIVRQAGFEEGELLFSRYPILGFERIRLSPLSSELGDGRIALHARIRAPAPLDEFNVVLTHLWGGNEGIRTAQAADLVNKLGDLTAGRPTIFAGDLGDPVESATYQVFRDAGFADPGWAQPLVTCCRQGVVGEQPELTSRPDCIMSQGFGPGSVQLFAEHPVTQGDGTKLYASDHNGLFAVFALEGG